VEDVDVVKQAVEDGGGEDLVAREDFRPVPHVLVRGQDDRALLVAGGDETEEEIRLVPVERPKAHLIDEQECAVEIALRFEPRGRDRSCVKSFL
jgi:hypothetical protein